MAEKYQTLKGFRDFLPQQMAIRNRIKRILIDVFEACGFEPLSTPDLEYAELLLGKYGDEADKLVYTFEDQGGRMVGMPYDLTVPTARVVASYSEELPQPFKRYQIQKVHRAENTQKGRYREFEQCDADILNCNSNLADAEILSIIFSGLSKLNIPEFSIKINSRPILNGIFREAGIPDDKIVTAAISVDKMDKMDVAAIKEELTSKSIAPEAIDKLFEIFSMLSQEYPDGENLIESHEFKIPNMSQEFEELKTIVANTVRFGVDPKFIIPTFNLARGLDYYTGIIFEATSTQFPGSIAAGGRYDQLIENLGGPSWPAVGVAFGIDRLVDIIESTNTWQDIPVTPTQILITVFSPELMDESQKVTKLLRESGVNAEIYLDPNTKLDKQLKFADRKKIPWVAILGPNELASQSAVLKNLKSGTQEDIKIIDLPHKIR